jgi:branched-chain amino acid transport system permease protein
MTYFLQQLVNGLTIGSTYALVAVGFALVYGVVGILNAAQADIATLTGYVGLYFAVNVGLGFWGAVGGVIVSAVLAGVVVYYVIFARLRTDNLLAMFVATIGLSFVIEYGVARVKGSAPDLFPSYLPGGSFSIGGVQIEYAQLIVFCVSVTLCVGLWLFVRATSIGRQMRAVAASPEIATTLGINAPMIRLGSVVISSLLAGVAGLLLATLYSSVNPFLGQTLAFNMFVIAIVGGVGSILGTLSVSLLVGIIPAVTSTYLNANVTATLPLALMMLVLLVKPEGLVGGTALRSG